MSKRVPPRAPRIAVLLVLLAACGSDGSPSSDDAGAHDSSIAALDASRDATEPHAGCTQTTDCTLSVGGPPVNACLTVAASARCVYTCASDDDCLAPFYAACSAKADDGTRICGDARDAGALEDAGVLADAGNDSAALGCTSSGGSVTRVLCCEATAAFPNTCAIGACGCSPTSSHEIDACDCPSGTCFDGAKCR